MRHTMTRSDLAHLTAPEKASGTGSTKHTRSTTPGSIAVACALMAAATAAPAASQRASDTTAIRLAQATTLFNLPAQPLSDSLRAIAAQTNSNILFDRKLVDGLNARPFRAELSIAGALAELLRDTELDYRRVDDQTVMIVSRARQTNTAQVPSALERTSWRMAQENTEQNVANRSTDSADTTNATRESVLTEVIVTAQKRSERLQDVPVPVTAVSGNQLAEGNRPRLEDYYAQVPGFSLSTDTMGPMVSIRGITPAGFGNPTVGFMIDDVPTGASTSYGGGFLAPEVDPSDLDRIEVLRGPQGTLYGASSMGGLVKYVTVSPSTDKLSGRVQAGSSGVEHGDSVGYNLSARLNVPMSDSFAVLASGFRHRDPGYIENVRTGDKGLNEATVTGGHLSTLWEPSSLFSVKLSAMLQRASQIGSAFAAKEPGFGDLQQDFLPNADSLNKKFENYSATINADLGDINLVSVTGYAKTHIYSKSDSTRSLGELTALSFPATHTVDGIPVTNTVDALQVDGEKLSSELRLTIPFGETFEWLVGGFYTHESTPTVDDWIATDDNTQVTGLFARLLVDTTYNEKAAFTDLTYRVTDRLDLQIGGRYSRIHQTFQSTDIGPYVEVIDGETSPLTYPSIAGDASASTYLLTPRFKITPELMLYGRFASGYRAGGVNAPTLVHVDGIPSQFAPDKTLNYEVGMKGDMFDRLLQFDASVYYIDWKNIQIGLVDPQSSISFYTNGASAKSQGIELSVQAAPVTGLRLGGWIAWNDAVLTRDLPPGSASMGLRGDRLPASSRVSGNTSVDYEVPLGQYVASFGWTMTYVGERMGDFTETTERQVRPAYLTHDLRMGTELNEWNVDLYFNNVTDRRGMVGGGIGSLNATYFEYIRPRTVALSVGRTF
jgi:iron complex outermembrane recepter protein